MYYLLYCHLLRTTTIYFCLLLFIINPYSCPIFLPLFLPPVHAPIPAPVPVPVPAPTPVPSPVPTPAPPLPPQICLGPGYVGGKGPRQARRRREAFALCRGQEEAGWRGGEE